MATYPGPTVLPLIFPERTFGRPGFREYYSKGVQSGLPPVVAANEAERASFMAQKMQERVHALLREGYSRQEAQQRAEQELTSTPPVVCCEVCQGTGLDPDRDSLCPRCGGRANRRARRPGVEVSDGAGHAG